MLQRSLQKLTQITTAPSRASHPHSRLHYCSSDCILAALGIDFMIEHMTFDECDHHRKDDLQAAYGAYLGKESRNGDIVQFVLRIQAFLHHYMKHAHQCDVCLPN